MRPIISIILIMLIPLAGAAIFEFYTLFFNAENSAVFTAISILAAVFIVSFEIMKRSD